MVVTAKCAHCGAQIIFSENEEVAICKYCESVNAIHEKTISEDCKTLGTIDTKEVLPELTYIAGTYLNYVSQIGRIWIGKEELYFKPIKLNLGDVSKRFVRIQNICGYEKRILPLGDFAIHTNNGHVMELNVFFWQRKEVLRAIEMRRKAYFQTRNLPIPKLIKGSYDPPTELDVEY